MSAEETMWALVYEGPGRKSLKKKPKPKLQLPTDAIVKVLKTTICGTDLHILKGDVPEVEAGRTLGHEGVGVIEEAGSAVSNFKKGDHVLISCITSDGRCEACRRAMYSHCEHGGWVLGHMIDGTQAEYVRIPFADTSLYAVPNDIDEEALTMLSDILPTGFECGVLNGKIKPGDTVAIVGAGPIGLATLLTAQFYSPAEIILIDQDDYRLETAQKLGATRVINSRREDAVARIFELTMNRGVDVAIEAVGIPETFEICTRMVAPGGHVANIGVHGKAAALHLESLWSKNVTITTRLVDTETTSMLLKIVKAGKLKPQSLITHRFELKDIVKAYETFADAAQQRVLKVIINGPPA